MSTPQPHPRSRGQLFVLALALILCHSGSHSASGQIPDLNTANHASSSYSAPDPSPQPKGSASKRPAGNRSRRTPNNFPQSPGNTPLDKNQQAIGQAIADGNLARGKNNYGEALDYYQQAQSLNPQEARAFYGMGNVYADLYCYDSTIAAYLKALEIKEDYLEAFIGLGYAYAGKERYDDAEKQFNAALKLNGNSVDANIGLGRMYLAKGKYQEAITRLNLVINSASVEAKDRAAAHVALGDVYWKQEKRQDAIAQFKEAIRLKPDLAFAYVELGNAQASIAYSKLGGFTSVNEVSMADLEALHASEKEAVANLEDAKKYHYNHPNLHQYKALALAYQFRYDDALSELKDYFTEVEKLDVRISSQATQCGDGFNRLKANGFQYRGLVYHLEGYFEPDAQRKIEFYDKALDQFNQAIAAKQDFASAYFMRGLIYVKQKKYEEAINQYKKAVLFSTEEPVRASLYEGIGQAYARLGRYGEAIDNMQEGIRRDPNNPSIHESLASIYVSQGKLEDGLAQQKKAGELRNGTATDSSSYYQLGVTYSIRFGKDRNEEDYNEAIRLLKKAIESNPRFALAYQGLGMTYYDHSNADEALANFNKANEYDPTNPVNYLYIALVHSELKHNEDAAISYFKKALELKPDYAQAYYRWGSLRFVRFAKNGSEEDFNEAVKAEKEALKLKPDFADAYYTLGAIYDVRFVKNKKEEDFNEAIRALKEAVKIKPDYALAYQGLGMAYLSHSNADEALTNFNRAIEYDPTKNLVNYLNVARVYLELKHDNEAAIKQLFKVIEIDPKNLDAYSTLGDIYRRQKNYSEAIKYLTIGIKNVPTVPWTYKDLAKVYEAQGKNEDAIHYYEEALQRLGADDASVKNLYLGRVARLKGQYAEAIEYFHQVNFPDGPAQSYFDIGVTYVVARNKKAAMEQHQQLLQIKSTLAEELLKKINEMK